MKGLIRIGLAIGFMASVVAYADGGGRMDGYGGGLETSGSMRSDEQMAIDAYNAGVELRDEAIGYEQEAAAAPDAKKQEKLLKKAQKSYAKAAGKFEKSVKHNPELYQGWSGFGHALRKTGDYERSLEAYKKALTWSRIIMKRSNTRPKRICIWANTRK